MKQNVIDCLSKIHNFKFKSDKYTDLNSSTYCKWKPGSVTKCSRENDLFEEAATEENLKKVREKYNTEYWESLINVLYSDLKRHSKLKDFIKLLEYNKTVLNIKLEKIITTLRSNEEHSDIDKFITTVMDLSNLVKDLSYPDFQDKKNEVRHLLIVNANYTLNKIEFYGNLFYKLFNYQTGSKYAAIVYWDAEYNKNHGINLDLKKEGKILDRDEKKELKKLYDLDHMVDAYTVSDQDFVKKVKFIFRTDSGTFFLGPENDLPTIMIHNKDVTMREFIVKLLEKNVFVVLFKMYELFREVGEGGIWTDDKWYIFKEFILRTQNVKRFGISS